MDSSKVCPACDGAKSVNAHYCHHCEAVDPEYYLDANLNVVKQCPRVQQLLAYNLKLVAHP